jgi:hypothetical protein
MFIESEAIITAMRYLMQVYEIPTYQSTTASLFPLPGLLAASLLADHYEFHVGLIPRLDTKSTLPGAKEAVRTPLRDDTCPIAARPRVALR